MMTLFSALCWHDSTTCHKSSLLCWPVLKHLLNEGDLLTPDDAGHLFKSVLMGMHCHGQHEATEAMLLTLGLQVYEKMVGDYGFVVSEIPTSMMLIVLFKFSIKSCSIFSSYLA